MDNVIPTIEELISKLETSGLEKYASELKEIKEAFQWTETIPLKRRQGLPRYKPLNMSPQEVVPTDAGPFAKPGEEVLEIAPEGEKKLKWPGKGAPAIMTPQLIKQYEKGLLDMDFLNDMAQKSKDPQEKAHIESLMKKAKEQDRIKCAAEKLLEISEKSRQSGYDDVASTLENAAADVVKAGTPERHTVASIEECYEKSENSADWGKNLKKLIDVHKGVVGILDMFVKTYRQKAAELAKGQQTDQEADELGKLVRDTDKKIQQKFDELDREISQ
ncbi:MAG: hypothetical protein GF334_07215 [Candidatus Altiarchaeales archaeon]|nr:hypothetical protein [Candidatus Altiarchaeales archaeon]